MPLTLRKSILSGYTVEILFINDNVLDENLSWNSINIASTKGKYNCSIKSRAEEIFSRRPTKLFKMIVLKNLNLSSMMNKYRYLLFSQKQNQIWVGSNDFWVGLAHPRPPVTPSLFPSNRDRPNSKAIRHSQRTSQQGTNYSESITGRTFFVGHEKERNSLRTYNSSESVDLFDFFLL